MTSELFTAASGLRAAVLASVIPPACRREPGAARVSRDGDSALIESPDWTPGPGVRELVPSFSLLGSPACSFRFELSVLSAGAWTPWVPTATIGPPIFGDGTPPSDVVAPRIDMYSAASPLERVRLRVRIHPADAVAGPWLMALSASDPSPPPASPVAVAVAQLAIPARSQMVEGDEIRERICSPTCVAMVLEFWGRPGPVPELAAEVYHRGLDLYGVWPAAIHAAARRGVAGYLLRFPDWESAAWCLARGLPVIASIRFELGELPGSPIARTGGHLVVLAGADGDAVVVNDPAAPARGEVVRRYPLREFCRAWLERGGVGYVLFAP